MKPLPRPRKPRDNGHRAAMVDFSVEITQAIHKARAAGLTRAEVAGVVEQTLQSHRYDARVKP
jgi:hypothetical protein